MADSTASLFDTRQTWLASPLDALSAWLTDPAFVMTTRGDTQPLRASSVTVYRAMGAKFIRSVVLDAEEGARKGKGWRDISPEDIRAFLVANKLNKGIRNRYVRLLERLFDHLARPRNEGALPLRPAQ
jgi:hypothetical protein